MPKEDLAWPHAPTHRLASGGTFMVTAATYLKAHRFLEPVRLDVLQRALLKLTSQFGWCLEAWAVFPNHYHFIGHSPPDDPGATSLVALIGQLHSRTATWVNRLDATPDRKVWFNYWETRLTFEKSLMARLNYVHQNAVRHGVVRIANHYRWCSAAWFERVATPAQVQTIYGFPIDRVRVYDEFEVTGMEWGAGDE